MLTSSRLFFRGPVWAGGAVIGVATTAVGILGNHFWMWTCFGALSLVGAAFYTFHRNRIEAEKARESLPSRMDDLHREGIALLHEISAPLEPEVAGGETSVSLGAPAEWWERVE